MDPQFIFLLGVLYCLDSLDHLIVRNHPPHKTYSRRIGIRPVISIDLSLYLCRGCFFLVLFPWSAVTGRCQPRCVRGRPDIIIVPWMDSHLVYGGCFFLPAEIGVVNPRQSYKKRWCSSLRRGWFHRFQPWITATCRELRLRQLLLSFISL